MGDDPEASFNYGLCLAWTGQHRPAIACLEQVVSLEADASFNHAVEAWVLAEVLRQGGGAESLCDDLRYACTFPWKPGDTAELEAAFEEIRRIPTPAIRPGSRATTASSRSSNGWIGPCPRRIR